MWNPIQNCTKLVSILSQIHPIHTLPPSFFTIRFNIILSTLRSSKRSLPLGPAHQKHIYPLLPPPYVPQAPPIFPFYHQYNIWWEVTIVKFPMMHFPQVSCFLSLSKSHALLGTLFSNTLSLCSSLNVKEKFYAHIQQAKLWSLHILMFEFFYSKLEDRNVLEPSGKSH